MRTSLSAVLVILPLLVSGCGDDAPLDSSPVLAGTYTATQFSVTPTGQAAINVLASGGSLVITIAESGATSGSLTIPSSLTGTGQPETVSMSGTAVRSGSTVTFQQTGDSFVRDLEWTLDAVGLRMVNQVAGSAAFTITLTRQ
jgi:hypothetical protein